MRVAILLFDGFDELDGIGPFEVLRTAADMGADLQVELVTLEEAAQVTASHGLRVHPDGPLGGRPDVVIVPGGGWNDRAERGAWGEAQRGKLPETLARLHREGTRIATVCTGGMLAMRAGLTRGRPSVTHQSTIEELRAAGARVVEARVVDDGDLLTAGGVTAGLDLALWIVEREFGKALADAVARELEYDRRGDVWHRPTAAAGAGTEVREGPRG